jgi:acyl-CoA synthetase (AMP-forming)/AMP-acid ligase II
MSEILSKLRSWCEVQPSKAAWNFLDDKGEPIQSFTYRELDVVSQELAKYLLGKGGLKKGDRAMLVFFPGLEFMISLLACFKAGIVAVPVFPPDPRKLSKDLHHFVSIQQSSQASVALTHAAYGFAKKVAGIRNVLSTSGSKWPELKWVAVDDVIKKAKASAGATSLEEISLDANEVAFLQYTSGSTSEPKGVMISHGNLSHNEQLIAAELKTTTDTVCVSWLPQYHDMGLIGSYLGLLYCGGQGFYLSPISFLKNPVVWLKSMSRFKATHTQAPSFAFALATRKWREHNSGGVETDKLILSSMQHMINAAEPVDVGALEAFYAEFGPLGLKQGVVVPTYGLAEHTVFVCSGGSQVVYVRKNSLETNRAEIVSKEVAEVDPLAFQCIAGCGYPHRAEGVSLLIVDPESKCVLPDGSVGEVWVASPSKAQGYWGKPEATADDFNASVAADSSADAGTKKRTYLRTGDLAFLHQKELFICGRLKDLIIVRGTNHYPQDIERTAERCEFAKDFLRPGCSAAFSLSGGSTQTEKVVLVAELREGVDKSKLDGILTGCRDAVAAAHGVSLSSVCLIKPRTIPKTTSGKIARSWCRKAFLGKTLQIVREKEASAAAGAEPAANAVSSSADAVRAASGAAQAPRMLDSGDTSASAPLIENGDAPSNPGSIFPRGLSEEEVRNMSVAELEGHVCNALVYLAAQGGTILVPPLDCSAAVSTLGFDSLTLVQLKGMIENRMFCTLPDEFFFMGIATPTGIATAVKNGGLNAEQQAYMEQADGAAGYDPVNGEEADPAKVVKQKQPMCPWFTCCY